ncbi:replication protein A 32 kDa subunit B isoform X2 [Vitis vinifera]|uniref:replication protein A 32 kDa subunit B isoform X2 n=1 Tax=Vitis vinifera TaxID=29760 RepID=UPI00023B317C|nr:replication protein A 32 kDa subunit B isoform X2 [Vitis vinifera]|eukprot:XP_002268721.2 PREDICTED: replication protein A 32 kDa subunit B isoform X2 [Vitis vinifera]
MYSHSQFDGNAAFSGGGFMPSQATQAAEPGFSPARNRDTQALLPLTVKQISEAFLSSDDKSNFLIDGVEVNNVTLVGMVFNKAERVTDVGFMLDDGTGRIDCNRWVNEAVDTKEMEGILDGMYVRVHGHLKGFQGKRHLNVFSIRPVTDFNEIASHFIECIYVHIYNTKSRAGGPTQSHVTNPAIGTPLKGYQASQPNQFSGQYGAGLKGVDQLVIDYLQQPQSLARDQGVGRDELAQQLNVPVDKIMESIRSLEEEGLIYSTIDEWHYKSTGNG